ncbi:MAG: hypothetical protein WD969_01365 [Paracoccaceae bacterium]
MKIDSVTKDEHSAIRTLLLDAFPGREEAGLAEAIRASGDDVFELVA